MHFKSYHLKSLAALAITSTLSTISPVSSRSMEWTSGQNADVVIGQGDFDEAGAALQANTLEEPTDIAVDPTTGKVFICDKENSRVLRYSSYEAAFNGSPAEAVFGSNDFTTRFFSFARDRFNRPEGIFVDFAGRLWVADSSNHRVFWFDNASSKPNGPPADGVLGQENFTNSGSGLAAGRMSLPVDVVGDEAGTIWVADRSNRRVLRFDNAASKTDPMNNDADGVLGQVDFVSSTSGDGTGQFNALVGLALSSGGSLFTVDRNNRRAHRYDNAAAKSGLVAPDAVLGQDDNDESVFYGAAINAFHSPSGIGYSPVGDTLFISEENAHRVLVFTGASALNGRANAEALLGQTAAGLTGSDTTISTMNTPSGVAGDTLGRVYVADRTNNRVLRFSPAALSNRNDVRPDLLVGKRPAGQRGDNRYNGNGAGQTQPGVSSRSRPVRTFASAQNDGFATTSLTMRGRRGNRFFRAIYRSLSAPRGNATARFVRGQAATGILETNGTHRYRLDVIPTRAALGKRKTFNSLISGTDPRRSSLDAVRAIVRTR